MRKLISCSLLSVFLLPAAIHTSSAAQEAALETRIDYGRRLITTGTLNDTGPHDFIVDTASTTTVIFENLARTQTIKPSGRNDLSIFGLTGVQQLPTFVIGDLKFGPYEFPDLVAPILSDWRFFTRTPQGVLGLNFFNDKTVIFDIANDSLTFFEGPEAAAPILSDWRRATLKRSTFALSDTPLLLAEMTIARQKIPFIIDTGSELTVVNLATLERFPIVPRDALDNLPTDVSDVYGDSAPAFRVFLPRMKIGGVTWRNRAIYAADAPFFSEIGYDEKPIGILGLDFLKRQRFAIDFANDKIYFEPEN